MAMLEVNDIHTFYGHIEALKGVSLTVGRGEVVTLIGSNGAGKSTTLRAISGTHKPRSGSVKLAGRDIHHMPAHEVVALGIAHSPEGRKVFSRMTVYENLQMGAFSRKGERITEDIARVYDLFPRLRERRTQKAGTLSGGEQQMLAVGRALMTNPGLLLLDEPLEGLAPVICEELMAALTRLASSGEMTILLVEQYYDFARSLADQYLVMERGEIVARGAGADMERDGVKRLLAV
jgi:branched-chain amino acid transport system ATP-binding protein